MNQSSFKPRDSCINQRLWITHKIYKSFENGPEVRSLFLDISKAFDKVQHEGFTFKQEQKRHFRWLIEHFKRLIVLHDQVSTRTGINAGVPQGSILGLLLLFVSMIYLTIYHLMTNYLLMTRLIICDVNVSARELNEDLKLISDWAFPW